MLYKYEVKQDIHYNTEGSKVITDNYYLVGVVNQPDWSDATEQVEGTEEFNAKVTGDRLTTISITPKTFTVNGTDVVLDGTETALSEVMAKIALVVSNVTVESHTEQNNSDSTSESWLVLTSTGTPGVSDSIVITGSNLNEIGLTADTTNGTKPTITQVNKILLGETLPSNQTIDNPDIFTITRYYYNSGTQSQVIKRGYTSQEIIDLSIPLTINKTTYSYVETEYDDGVDSPLSTFYSSGGGYLYIMENGTYRELIDNEKADSNTQLLLDVKWKRLRCIEFGQEILAEFTEGNMLMGITDTEANQLRVTTEAVLANVSTGSLTAALIEMDLIPRSSPYLTEARISYYYNKIVAFLQTI